ncbi:MAG: methionyl-tRNA formyltransferase [Polaromonas sp.]|nr:methionyl-tRNA formyltransferase [Polaromonas sp.]
MRVIFAGTPEFARVALAQLHAAGFDIALVLTQPDRPAGRGMKLQASAVKQWAQANHLPVAQPRSLRLDGKYPEDAVAAQAAIEAAHADVMVVAAYGLILPQWVLDAMAAGGKLGCLNIHASLLPRWRGAAPIHRAIEAGDPETGITIMQMDAGLDTGDMLLTERLAILPHDSTDTLHDRLAGLGGRMVVEVLELAACGGLSPIPQPQDGVTYARKIEKHEAQIDWTERAAVIERRVRAFNPFPVAFSALGAEAIKFREAIVLETARPAAALPGQVVAAGAEGVDVAAADGLVRLTRLQKAGGKALGAADFLRGFDIRPGMVFGAVAGT